MYNRYRRNGTGFYTAFFWVLVGFMLGQFIQLDISLSPSSQASQTTQNTIYLEQ